MPQQTNLNVSPYFDDYSPDSDYHKVLFKPGYPVQARELTGYITESNWEVWSTLF